jgi:hypothetical protein
MGTNGKRRWSLLEHPVVFVVGNDHPCKRFGHGRQLNPVIKTSDRMRDSQVSPRLNVQKRPAIIHLDCSKL